MTGSAAADVARVAPLILAAGSGRRMGGPNKLLAEIGGVSLIRHVAVAALASRALPPLVVTGHQAAAIEAALRGLDLRFVHNSDHAAGLSSSLAAGIAALDPAAEAAVVLLADMPFVDARTIDAIIGAFATSGRVAIVAPAHDGRRGNPVLWPRRFFSALLAIKGDRGGRDLLAAHAAEVVEVAAGAGVARDLDTPEALAAAGGRLRD